MTSLAQRQLADYDRRDPGSLLAGNAFAMNVDEAYALQFEVARLREARGERIAGYKVGCVSQVMQSQLGLDRPVLGHVFATELYASGIALEPGNFAGLAIEGELAVRIGRDGIVSAAFPVIELHNYTFRNNPHTAQELIGNNAIHAGVVLPDTEPPCADLALLHDAEDRGVAQRSRAWRGKRKGATRWAVVERGPANRASGAIRPRVARRRYHTHWFSLPLYRVSAGDQIDVASGSSIAVRVTVARTVVAGLR